VVCVSVTLYVDHVITTMSPAKMARNDRDRIWRPWRVDSSGSREGMLDGVWIPTGRVTSDGVSGQLESLCK